jgi:hypothetical protein
MGYLTIDYFVEPFIASNTTTEPQPYRYVTRDFLAAHDPQGLATYDRYIERVMSGSSRVIGYYMLSHGPDLTLNTPPSESAPVIRSFYDPTNGDMSNGDIVYFGDGMGFIH